MKKKVTYVVLGIMILLMGCGSKNEEKKEPVESSHDTVVESSSKDEVVEEPISEEQSTYEAAIEAKEKGYYKVAETLFESIKGYEDATERYNELKSFLAQYDGTYYGESTKYKNVYVYLYINDGVVKAQFEGQDMSHSTYELYRYGTLPNGEPFIAFSNAISDRYSADYKCEYSDGVAIRKQDDGSYFLAPTEGGTLDTWNGFYTKK